MRKAKQWGIQVILGDYLGPYYMGTTVYKTVTQENLLKINQIFLDLPVFIKHLRLVKMVCSYRLGTILLLVECFDI